MKIRFMGSTIIMLLLAVFIVKADPALIIKAANAEITNTMEQLKSEEFPPYFISYGITELKTLRLSAQFGKIQNDSESLTRTLDIDLRVGSPAFDNTHIIRGQAFSFGGGRMSAELPVEDDEQVLRSKMWYSTDAAYKDAVQKYEKLLTNRAVKVKEEDSSADLSKDQIYKYSEKEIKFDLDKEEWKNRLRRLSQLFSDDEKIYYGAVSFSIVIKNKYFISSEGAEIFHSEPFVKVYLSAQTKADDGMSLPLYESYFAFSPDRLPSEEDMRVDLIKMMQTLKDLRDAPLMTTFSGPAILSGAASGVFFHEIFGHRVEGHRLKDPNDAQTFKSSVGEKIIADFVDVVFDPTIKEYKGVPVSGYYKYDDEGIEGQKVTIVKEGIFKNFLMSRSPIDGFNKSNGHGRRQAGYKAVSRQSNLLVIPKTDMPLEDLRKVLIEECKKQEKEFGLLFTKVQGGFTFTGRTIPNSFNVNPLVVYKIFVDGSPDQLVRGADLIGTPLTTFSNIIGAGNDMGVFNGTCGAESGGVPVSACSPSILVSKIEVQKKAKSQAKPPLLEAPKIKKTP